MAVDQGGGAAAAAEYIFKSEKARAGGGGAAAARQWLGWGTLGGQGQGAAALCGLVRPRGRWRDRRARCRAAMWDGRGADGHVAPPVFTAAADQGGRLG